MNPAGRSFLAWVSNVSDSKALRITSRRALAHVCSLKAHAVIKARVIRLLSSSVEALKQQKIKELCFGLGQEHIHTADMMGKRKDWLTASPWVPADSYSKTENFCTLWGSPLFSLQLCKLRLNRWHFNMPLSAMSYWHHYKWALPLSIESNHFLHHKHCILIPAHTRAVLTLSKGIQGCHICKIIDVEKAR